jgi:hypothetical protein
MTPEQAKEEYEKCKASAYYFMTKYCTVNGKPFTTNLNEEEFNLLMSAKEVRFHRGRNSHGLLIKT